MFKTLLALAVAMTATTALLGWVDPSVTLLEPVATVEGVLPTARELVGRRVGANPGRWQRIEVALSARPAPSSRMLTANLDRNDHHFSVDERGRLSSTHRWREQTRIGDRSDTIRIRVSSMNEGAELSEAQLNALRALVLALDEAVSPPENHLSVTLQRG